MIKTEKPQELYISSARVNASINKPKIAIIRVLEACNAGCFMCAFAFSKDNYRFERDKLKEIISNGNGALKVIRLTGGEPLLLDNISDLLHDIKEAGISSSIISNGWYLSEKTRKNELKHLDQIIISIDGPTAEKHNKFRRLPGLFEKLLAGIRAIKFHQPRTLIRVNTVVGHHNFHLLREIYDMLGAEGINQWSLIPLKRSEGTWGRMTVEEIIKTMSAFNQWVHDHPNNVKILGYGLKLYGRTDEEIRDNWLKSRNMAPQKQCQLVDLVRYYVPKEDTIFPCNCVPHRSGSINFSEGLTPESFNGSDLAEARSWLRNNGPKQCKGCEPINAALGDGVIDLETDIFGF